MQRFRKIIFDGLSCDLPAQKICPKEFAKWCRIFRKSAGPAQLTCETAVGIVLEICDAARQRAIWASFTVCKVKVSESSNAASMRKVVRIAYSGR